MSAATGPDRYAVIGHPIAHSRSPQIHRLFAEQTHQHLSYEALDVTALELPSRVGAFFASGGRGLNVTVPHKRAIVRLCERLTPRARSAGVINTLAMQADRTLLGDNTDGAGFVRDLCVNHSVQICARSLLLLGAGGAAQGLLPALLEQHPARLQLANRHGERARELAAQFSELASACDVPLLSSDLAGLAADRYDLIVNATAAGLAGQLPALPDSAIDRATLCYDLAYGEAAAPFVRWALEHGAAAAYTGLGMLVEQAAESFLLWRGVRPDTGPVLAALRSS